jgi:hypothetical protein
MTSAITTSERRLLQLALIGLEAERDRVEQELNDVRRRLGLGSVSVADQRVSINAPLVRRSPNKGRPMSEAQKRAISRTMKKRWAGIRRKQ